MRTRFYSIFPRMASMPPVLLAALLVGVVACGGPGKQDAPDNGEGKLAQEATPAQGGPAAQAVEVWTLEPRAFTLRAEYIGHLLPWERAVLRARKEGVAEAVRFEESAQVSQGEFLVNISTDQLKVRRDLAKANLELAESSYSRAQQLDKKKLLPPAQLEETRTKREQARLSLRLAEIELDDSIARSPLNGTVLRRGVNVGEFVNKGQMLAEILDLGRVKALIHVPEKEIRHLVPGNPVRVLLDALPGNAFEGSIHTIGLEADRANRSFPVEVRLENAEGLLRPGMLARVDLELQSYQGQILIPRHTVLERASGRVVFVAKDGLAVERPIETGVTRGQDVQVLQGLGAGEMLIVTGQHRLTNGDPITVKGKPLAQEGNANATASTADPAQAKVARDALPDTSPAAAKAGQDDLQSSPK